MDIDEHINFSPPQKDTLIPQRVAESPQPKFPKSPRTPKKTRLERLHLSETTIAVMRTTTAIMRTIRRVHVERLPEYFEQTCDWRQNEIAVICGSSRLTYQELDQQANRLAHFLISCGIGEGNPVGILLERSIDTYIALLGVLKAGAAFVPLDPSFSSDRVAFIAENAGLRGLVTTSAFREKTRTLPYPVLELDQAQEALSVQHETRPQVHVDPASLCYIIYTLDTTGRPKGVAVSHANIVNFLRVATPIYGVRRNDQVYQGMSTAFDFSLAEIWPTWIAGATLVAGPIDSNVSAPGSLSSSSSTRSPCSAACRRCSPQSGAMYPPCAPF
jgi:non-ribosomal peptide synthetase component F